MNWIVAETSTRQNIQHSLETDIHAADGIRTYNSSKQAAVKPHLRPHGHRDWLKYIICGFVHELVGTWLYCGLANSVFYIALYVFFDVKAGDRQLMLLVSI
jgi:hypothetical protein